MPIPSYNLCTLILVGIFSCFDLALADTEIINFDAISSVDVDIPQSSQWLAITATAPERTLLVQPAPLGTRLTNVCESQNCTAFSPSPHEIWVKLDLDSPEWYNFSKFTLRMSWPANYPTQFHLEAYTPHRAHGMIHGPHQVSHQGQQSVSTRKRYAHIRLVDKGVRTPPTGGVSPGPVPFRLLLEPLYFGVLPKSVIPTVSFIALVALFSAFVVAPLVNKKLADVAAAAKHEELTNLNRMAGKKAS